MTPVISGLVTTTAAVARERRKSKYCEHRNVTVNCKRCGIFWVFNQRADAVRHYRHTYRQRINKFEMCKEVSHVQNTLTNYRQTGFYLSVRR